MQIVSKLSLVFAFVVSTAFAQTTPPQLTQEQRDRVAQMIQVDRDHMKELEKTLPKHFRMSGKKPDGPIHFTTDEIMKHGIYTSDPGDNVFNGVEIKGILHADDDQPMCNGPAGPFPIASGTETIYVCSEDAVCEAIATWTEYEFDVYVPVGPEICYQIAYYQVQWEIDGIIYCLPARIPCELCFI
jgi:hypothetical protein